MVKYHDTPESKNITRIGYNSKNQTMHIEFSNGGLYHYPGITAEQFAAFLNTESKGAHFSANFRGWPFRKIEK